MNTRIAVLAALIVAPVPLAQADVLYTTNYIFGNARSLVRIDTVSGAVTTVGTIAHPLGPLVELAWHNNRIYAIDYRYFEPGVTMRLVSINPSNPADVTSVPVSLGGTPLTRPGALASVGGNLILAYGSGPEFTTIADLSLSGIATNPVDYSALSPGFRMHGLTGNAAGRILSIDNDYPMEVRLHDLTRSPASVNLFTIAGNGLDRDIELIGNRIATMDSVSWALSFTDATTGQGAGHITLPNWSDYKGLAIPSPAAAVWLFAAGALIASRRR